MHMNPACVQCLLGKKLNDFPATATPEEAAEYRRRVLAAVEAGQELSSPEMDREIDLIHEDLFGYRVDYAPIKRHFNELLLTMEPALRAGVAAAEDPLERAIQYAMTGNFIDFAALGSVDEGELQRLLDRSGEISVDAQVLTALRRELSSARRLLFMTDNCGEIVLDKVLMRTIREQYPQLQIAAMVRGEPVVNDATLEDAEQVGLGEVADRILGSGCGYAGNPLERLSEEALRAVRETDVLIAKGQANYEALNGRGLNLFYIFMCKCDLFMRRFGVPQFTGLLTQEDF